jgi:uncharacterized protein
MNLKIILLISTVLLAGCSDEPSYYESGAQTQAGQKSESNKPKQEGEDVTMKLNQALLQAADQGKTEEVIQAIKDGANVNAQDGQGRTPMMLATLRNDPKTVKALIDAGADVNIQADNKDNPYLYSGAEGYLEILKMTIEAGADMKLTNRYNGTALIPAAEHGHNDVIEYLLKESDVDVNHINNLGWTALMEAIVLGSGGKEHQRAVELLIEYGADVNIPDRNGVTALAHAKSEGFTEIAEMLEKAGGKLKLD